MSLNLREHDRTLPKCRSMSQDVSIPIRNGGGAPERFSSWVSIDLGLPLMTLRGKISECVGTNIKNSYWNIKFYECYTRLLFTWYPIFFPLFRYLKDNLPFIHPKHIAIWGWFYGGYVAASALGHDETVFKCAASVAPVTSWRYYGKKCICLFIEHTQTHI